MRKYDPNWFAGWEEELMPLSQSQSLIFETLNCCQGLLAEGCLQDKERVSNGYNG